MSEVKSNSRCQYLDMAKGMGMIIVIMFHVGLSQNMEMFVGAFMLPVFFIISGYCFKFREGFWKYVKNKSIRLLVPYFFFGAILLLAYYVGLGEFKVWAIELLLQRRFTTLWYVATLYWALIIFWLVCKISKNNINVIIAVSTILGLAGMVYNNVFARPLFWNIDTAVAVQIYLAMGYACKQKNIEAKLAPFSAIEKNLMAIVLFAISYALSFLNRFLGFESLQLYFSEYGCIPLTLASALIGSLALVLLASSIQTKYITYVGKNSMTFLALHQAVFMEMIFIIYGCLGINYLKIDGTTTFLYGCITFVFAMLCCTIVNRLLKKTHIGKFI